MDIGYKNWIEKQIECEREVALNELKKLGDDISVNNWFRSKRGKSYLKIIENLQQEIKRR